MNPPNIREVDCCATCEYGWLPWGECHCECCKDGYKNHKLWEKCDDFKRED